MERALEQADVVLHILTCIDSKDTLSKLARVSRFWSTLALDQLWGSHIVNVNVLARCMAMEYWHEIEINPRKKLPFFRKPWDPIASSSQLVSSGKLRRGEWLGSRFQTYAARIRSLEVCDYIADRPHQNYVRTSRYDFLSKDIRKQRWLRRITGAHTFLRKCLQFPNTSDKARYLDGVSYSLHSSVLYAWHEHSRDVAPLFPRLVHLLWSGNSGSPTQTELFRTFVGPTLQKLTLGPSWYYHRDSLINSAEACIRAVLSISSSLNCLELEDWHIQTSLFKTVISHDLHRLCAFRCFTPISHEMFQFLISLPYLKSLDVCLQDEGFTSPEIVSASVSPTGLFSLCELRILSISALGAQKLLQSIQSSTIHSLMLRGPWALCSHAQLCGLIKAIAHHASAPSIRRLGLIYSSARNEAELGLDLLGPSIPHDITPFLELRNLEHIELAQFVVDVKRISLLAMLIAWPHLINLRVQALDDDKVLPLSQFLNIMSQVPTTRIECISGFEISCPLTSVLPKPMGIQYPCIQRMIFTVPDSDMYGPTFMNDERALLAFYLTTTFPNHDFFNNPMLLDWKLCGLIRAADRARRAGTEWSLSNYKIWAADHDSESSLSIRSYRSFESIRLNEDSLFDR